MTTDKLRRLLNAAERVGIGKRYLQVRPRFSVDDFIISRYPWSLYYDAILWVWKALPLREVLYYWLIEGVCFWVISVVLSAAVSRQAELELFYHVYIAQCIPTTWQRQH